MTTKQRAFTKATILRSLKLQKASHLNAAQALLTKADKLIAQAGLNNEAAAECEIAIAALEGQQPELPLGTEPTTPPLSQAEATAAVTTVMERDEARANALLNPTETVATPAGNLLHRPHLVNGKPCEHPQTGRNDYGDRVCLTEGCGQIIEFAPKWKANV